MKVEHQTYIVWLGLIGLCSLLYVVGRVLAKW